MNNTPNLHELSQALSAIPPEKRQGYALFEAKKTQAIRRLPFMKASLALIFHGEKRFSHQVCQAGQFLFVEQGRECTLSNEPIHNHYLSCFIEFENDEIEHLPIAQPEDDMLVMGDVSPALKLLIQQYAETCSSLPDSFASQRRIEILQLLQHEGFTLSRPPAFSTHYYQTMDLIQSHLAYNWQLEEVAQSINTSVSTLRRNLTKDGTSFKELNDRIKLGHGFYLLQTSQLPISIVASECGYQSQSRFSERFQKRFGLLPSKLRATK